ncbi:MAG: hypothetical protein H0U47_08240 [Nocardioidaceae bacterium]|nr:hypothetical protein [Nocardioidaceae bacterium]
MDEISYFLAQQRVADRTRDATRHHERLGGAPWPTRRRTTRWLQRRKDAPDDPT